MWLPVVRKTVGEVASLLRHGKEGSETENKYGGREGNRCLFG